MDNYGRQGWWPIINNKTLFSEYHHGTPVNENECFEIALGAILTQNIAWKNVEKAICVLKQNSFIYPEKLYAMPDDKLASYIKPTGYYNQKTKKIKNFLRWSKKYNFSFEDIKQKGLPELREELLSIHGIGPETADSILLYALSMKVFVVDAYTGRIFKRIGILYGNEKYPEIQKRFHDNFKGETQDYNEYHALIVAHGKDICRKKPKCHECCLTLHCNRNF